MKKYFSFAFQPVEFYTSKFVAKILKRNTRLWRFGKKRQPRSGVSISSTESVRSINQSSSNRLCTIDSLRYLYFRRTIVVTNTRLTKRYSRVAGRPMRVINNKVTRLLGVVTPQIVFLKKFKFHILSHLKYHRSSPTLISPLIRHQW